MNLRSYNLVLGIRELLKKVSVILAMKNWDFKDKIKSYVFSMKFNLSGNLSPNQQFEKSCRHLGKFIGGTCILMYILRLAAQIKNLNNSIRTIGDCSLFWHFSTSLCYGNKPSTVYICKTSRKKSIYPFLICNV